MLMSVRILAFSTTTELCSVALMIDKHIYYRDVVTSKRHSERILFMIDQLLSESGLNLQSLDCIFFDRGPGSFVGMRIGISVAQGLSLGADLPLVEVSSLVILAQGAWRIFGATQIITTIDARIGELYWANYYRTVDNSWIIKNNEKLVTEILIRQLVSSLQGNWVLVGTGWNKYSTLVYVKKEDAIILRSIMFPQAQDIFSVGLYKWKKKLFIAPDRIKPIYLYNRNRVCIKKYKNFN